LNKSIVTLCLCVVSGAAVAQSSVTLYGVADAALTYVSNAKGARQYLMTNGNEAGDRWGLSGVEDLGGA
jgi:predicted porin